MKRFFTLTTVLLLSLPITVSAKSIQMNASTTINGAVSVLGTLSKGSGTFYIDHPLDPKNKLLYHSFVESPDVKNIYDGIVLLDSSGNARIELPGYFLALNKDFRYLATPIGAPMPHLHLASEVKPAFLGMWGKPVLEIAGGAPGKKVSWQVTGIRHDALILDHPIIVSVEKGTGNSSLDKGQYLCPECYAK